MRYIPNLNIILLILLFSSGSLSARGWHVAPDGKDYAEYQPAVAGDYNHPLKLEFVLTNKLPNGGILVSPGDTVWVHGNLFNFSGSNASLHYRAEDYTPYTGYFKALMAYKNTISVSDFPYDFYKNNCFPDKEVRPVYDNGQEYTFKQEIQKPDSCTGNLGKTTETYQTHIKAYVVSDMSFPGFYTSYLKGSPTGGPAEFNHENPVIVRAYGNERVTIDGKKFLDPSFLSCYRELRFAMGIFSRPMDCLLTIEGQYTYFWGIEITNSDPNHLSLISEANKTYDIGTDGGVLIEGTGNRVINCIVHNNIGDGMAAFSVTTKSKIDGCMVYNNGFANTSTVDRSHGHNIYTANNPDSAHSYKEIANNFIFDAFDIGLQVYKTSKADGPITGYKIHDNVIFNSGKIAQKIIPSTCVPANLSCKYDLENIIDLGGRKYYSQKYPSFCANIILSGHSGMQDADIYNNHIYDDISFAKGCGNGNCSGNPDNGGYVPDNFVVRSQGPKYPYENIRIENNYIIGGLPVQLEDMRHSRFRNNFMYGNKRLLVYSEGIDTPAFKLFPENKNHHYILDWDKNTYVYNQEYIRCDMGAQKYPILFQWDIQTNDSMVKGNGKKIAVHKTYTASGDLNTKSHESGQNFASNEPQPSMWKGFQSTLGLELNPAWYSPELPPDWNTPKEFFIGNMDSGRKGMVVYNLGKKPVDFYTSKLGDFVPVGHQFRIRDVQDYYNKEQQFTGTFTGEPVRINLANSLTAGTGHSPRTKEYPGNMSYKGYIKNYTPEISGKKDGINNTDDSYHTDEGFNTFIIEFAPAFSLEAKNLGNGRYEVTLKNAEGYLPGSFVWSNSEGLKMEAGSTPRSCIITVSNGKCVTVSAIGNYFYNGLSGTEKIEICNK